MPNTILSHLPQYFFSHALHGVQLLAPDIVPDSHSPVVNSAHSLNVILREGSGKPTGTPIWRLEDEGERYRSVIRLFGRPQGLLLDIACEGSGTFDFANDSLTICWKQGGTGPAHYLQCGCRRNFCKLRLCCSQ